MNGAVYDAHPFLLLNHNDDYESLSKLAHEWGEAMHSWLANHAQPFVTADSPTFGNSAIAASGLDCLKPVIVRYLPEPDAAR